MPPARSIHVNREQMLRTVIELSDEQQAAARERTKTWAEFLSTKEIDARSWVRRNVGQFAKKPLTPSEAKRHQQALVEMGRDGLVELDPSHCRPTDAGRAALESLK